MAQITIDIPDAQLPRVRAAFAARAGFDDPADMTLADAKAVLADLIVRVVRAYEREEAQRAVVVTDVDVT